MNTNLENKSNKVGEARKQLQDSIAEECRKIVNMTNVDFEKEYENHKLDSLRVICALYGIDPVELMKILCDHSVRQSIETRKAEFEQIYNEPLYIDEGGVVENRTFAPKISQEARKAFVDAAKNGGVERVMEYFELKHSDKVDRENLLKDLGTLMNNYGIDTICNMPDFILADTLLDAICSIEKLQGRTNKWFGRDSEIGKQ